MDFFEQWTEYDYNPFILFDSSGKVISLNKEAQFLLGEVSSKEIYELTKTYANITFGFKTTMLELNIGKYSFFGFTIGYIHENNIGIKLYRCAMQTFNPPSKNGQKTNIYTILDLCISATSTQQKTEFKKYFDPTFPLIWLQIEDFTKLLSKLYSIYQQSSTITTSLMLKTGEYIKFQDKKYPIFTVSIQGDVKDDFSKEDILDLSKEIGSNIKFYNSSIHIETPLITADDS